MRLHCVKNLSFVCLLQKQLSNKQKLPLFPYEILAGKYRDSHIRFPKNSFSLNQSFHRFFIFFHILSSVDINQSQPDEGSKSMVIYWASHAVWYPASKAPFVCSSAWRCLEKPNKIRSRLWWWWLWWCLNHVKYKSYWSSHDLRGWNVNISF